MWGMGDFGYKTWVKTKLMCHRIQKYNNYDWGIYFENNFNGKQILRERHFENI